MLWHHIDFNVSVVKMWLELSKLLSMVFSIIYGRIRSDITHLIVASEFLRFSYDTKFDAKAFIADVFNRKNLYEKFPSAY